MTKIYKSDKNKVLKSEKRVYIKADGVVAVYRKTSKVQPKYNSNQFPKKTK